MIAQAIQERKKALQKKVDLDQEAVLNGLYELARGAKAEAVRVSAWMGIAKILGLLVDKKEIHGKVQHSFNPYADLSPEALEMLEEQGREAEAQLALMSG